MTHLLDELRVFRLSQDLLNREWALHPRCNTRRRTQCPVFSSGASAGLVPIFGGKDEVVPPRSIGRAFRGPLIFRAEILPVESRCP